MGYHGGYYWFVPSMSCETVVPARNAHLMRNVSGRQWAFNLTVLVSSAFGLGLGGSPDYNTFLVLTALVGLGVGGNIPIDTTITLEFTPQVGLSASEPRSTAKFSRNIAASCPFFQSSSQLAPLSAQPSPMASSPNTIASPTSLKAMLYHLATTCPQVHASLAAGSQTIGAGGTLF